MMATPLPLARVLEAGFLATIQDRPRFGLSRYGLSEAGPMAPLSFAEANWLAGNAGPLPAIEVMIKPPRLLFLRAAWVAVAGADFAWRLDGKPVEAGRGFAVKPGETLQGDYCRSGLRGYIAVAGGWGVERWQGSASTHLQAALGGMRLERGRELPGAWEGSGAEFPAPDAAARRLRERPPAGLLRAGVKVLRVVPGAHADVFPPEAMSLFTGSTYRVTEQSSRVALRLDGLALPARNTPLLSSGAANGAVQVPPSGMPQVLAVEHPATGGYPVLANVIEADWETMGQLRPREEVRFGLVSLETAVQLLSRQAEWLARLVGYQE